MVRLLRRNQIIVQRYKKKLTFPNFSAKKSKKIAIHHFLAKKFGLFIIVCILYNNARMRAHVP